MHFSYQTVMLSVASDQLRALSDSLIGPPPSRGEVADVILKMRNIVSSVGWIQGGLFNANGVCMQGAFYYRDGIGVMAQHLHEHMSPLGMAVSELLARAIREQGHWHSEPAPSGWQSVIDFNDKFGTTKEEVLAILQAAWEIAAREAALEERPGSPAVKPPMPAPGFIPDFMLDAGVLAGVGT